MAAEGWDDDHIATPRSDHVPANNIGGAIIAAFEQPVRLQGCNQFAWGVCFENYDRIHKRQLRKRGGAGCRTLDRCTAAVLGTRYATTLRGSDHRALLHS